MMIRHYKIIPTIISIILLSYVLIIVTPMDVYIGLFDNTRNANKIRTVESLCFSHKGNGSFIYSSLDTLDAFIYKIVEIRRNDIGIPWIIGEADFYRKGHQKLERVYIWESIILKPKIKNELNSITFITDSAMTPSGEIESIISYRYISREVADSIVKCWNHPNKD